MRKILFGVIVKMMLLIEGNDILHLAADQGAVRKSSELREEFPGIFAV